MALPKITTPKIPFVLPTTGEEITIRQFLTKEYKAVMTAYNTKSVEVFVKTVADIINDCVVSPEDFDANKYHSYEIDYIFLQLYTTSVDGVVKVPLTCKNMVDKPILYEDELGNIKRSDETEKAPCGTTFTLEVPTRDVKISEISDGKFYIDANTLIVLKYPNWETWHRMAKEAGEVVDVSDDNAEPTPEDIEKRQTEALKMVYSSIESIWVNDEKWEEDFSEEEFIEWSNLFPVDKLEALIGFIQNTPQLVYSAEVTCPSCGNTETLRLVGLESFLK